MKYATRTLPHFFFILIVLVGAWSCQESGPSSKPTSVPIEFSNQIEKSHLSCNGNAKDVQLEYDADYTVAAAAVPRKEDGSYNEIYWNHVLYYGSMHLPFNFSEMNRAAGSKFMAMYPETVSWGEIKTSEISYPYDVKTIFHKDEIIALYPPLMAAYYSNIKKNPVKKGDKAIRIQARVKLRALFCNTKAAPPLESDNFVFYTPVDPQTAFEVVPYSDWRPIQNPIRGDRAKTNPCVSRDAIAVSPEHPEPTNGDFHYFWHPTLKDVDADGNQFDCSKWYVEGENFRRIKPSFFDHPDAKSKAIPYAELIKLKRPWEITIVSGVFRQSYNKFSADWLKPAIEQAITAKNQQEHQKILPAINRPGEEDLAVDRLLVMLWRLSLNYNIESKNIVIEPDYIEINLVGTLKHSGRKAKINMILGNTKNAHPSYPRFAASVGKLFIKSDIFMYEGHSGFGRSLSPEAIGIAEAVASTPQEEIPQHQVMAFFSCQSLFHYHPGKFTALPKIQQRTWIETLGDYVDVNGNGSLGVIASLEQYAKTGKSVPFDRWANDFANDNFMMLLEDSSAN